MSNNTEIFCSILEEEKQKLERWLFNKIIIGELKPCDLCAGWFGAGAASPRCLAKHPSPTSGTSCNTSLSKLLSIRICIYTLVTHAALIKKAEQSWHGVPGGTAKVNRSWEAVSRVTVCWAFTTGSLIKTERKNVSSAPALYHFYLQKEYFVSYKAVDNGARGALRFHRYLPFAFGHGAGLWAGLGAWLSTEFPLSCPVLALNYRTHLWLIGVCCAGIDGVGITEGCVFHCTGVCWQAGGCREDRK